MVVNEIPKYSVLMSVYYKENPQYLNLSIDSMLNQTILPDEFILVEDGPLTPELIRVIKKHILNNPGLFKIIKNKKNLGLGLSLKRGIKVAKNEWIARMDSDDYSIPTRCEQQLQFIRQNPEYEMVGSFEAEFINNMDNVISIHKVPEKMGQIKQFMHRRCAVLHPTVMYKKSAVIRSGNYRNVPLYEDYDLFSRMVLEYNIKTYNIQKSLYYIRTSPDFYKRRGGIRYAGTVLRFKWNQHVKGYMSLTDFIISGLGQAGVCILPNSLRKLFYMKVLR